MPYLPRLPLHRLATTCLLAAGLLAAGLLAGLAPAAQPVPDTLDWRIARGSIA